MPQQGTDFQGDSGEEQFEDGNCKGCLMIGKSKFVEEKKNGHD